MTISSTGIGSGLDVKSIVSSLVAIEKQPLVKLQAKASTFQTQLSLYGTIKSQMSALGDAAAALSGTSGWNAQTGASSNAAAVGVTVGTTASSAALTVNVTQLAQAQSTASVGVLKGTVPGASGKLTIQLGAWTDGSLVPRVGSNPVDVTVSANDTVSAIASKINAANAGVKASVLSDGVNDRLVLQSSTTGAQAGFSVTATPDAFDNVALGSIALANYGFTNAAVTAATQSAGTTTGMFMGQSALNANLTVNGVALAPATNNISDVTPGVSLQLSQVTTSPVAVTVQNDLTAVQKNIQSFVDAYNAISNSLMDATKYDASTKVAGPLQGDATSVGLLNALRSMMGSTSVGSTLTHLSDAGLERQKDGTLKINQTKLTSAMQDMGNLQKLFTSYGTNTATNGFGIKVRDFAHAMVTFDGRVTNKSAALQKAISSNLGDQDRVTRRASAVEAQLNKQYSALDAQMAQMTSLNSFVTAQLAVWNKA
jgi:flagellar hook-associated protein 2